MSATSQSSPSAASVLGVQSRTNPNSFHYSTDQPNQTGNVDNDVMIIWRVPSTKEFTLTNGRKVIPVRNSQAVKDAMTTAGIQTVGYITADHISVGGPGSGDPREYGPFYPLIDSFEGFDPKDIEDTMLIARDPGTGPTRFLLSESKGDNDKDGQRIMVGNIIADTREKRRDLILPICKMAARSLFDSNMTGTEHFVTIVDPVGLSDPAWARRGLADPSGALLEQDFGGTEVSWDLAVSDSRRCIASLLGLAGWPGSQEDLIAAVNERVSYLSPKDFSATPQGKKVTDYHAGDGDLSRYSRIS